MPLSSNLDLETYLVLEGLELYLWLESHYYYSTSSTVVM